MYFFRDCSQGSMQTSRVLVLGSLSSQGTTRTLRVLGSLLPPHKHTHSTRRSKQLFSCWTRSRRNHNVRHVGVNMLHQKAPLIFCMQNQKTKKEDSIGRKAFSGFFLFFVNSRVWLKVCCQADDCQNRRN